MAIVNDQVSLGTNTNAAGASITLTTTGAVASGGFIVLGVGQAGTETVSGASGGGLTYSVDKSAIIGGDLRCTIVSAQAPSGLAASTVITVNFTGVDDELKVCGTSFTGVKTSSEVDTTDNRTQTGTTAWGTNSMSIQAGSVIVAVNYSGFIPASPSSTITAPSTEICDFFTADGTLMTGGYRIESSAGSYTVAGTLSGNADNNTVAVAYLEEPVAPAEVVVAWITA